MEILYYFENKTTFMDQWQHYHIFDELIKHNCKTTVISPLEFRSIGEANEALIRLIKNRKFDLFITPYNHDLIYIETLGLIKKDGIPTLLICYDNLLIPYRHKKIAKYFDLVWLTSKETRGLFEKWGANVIFMPYAANPYNFKPSNKEEINRIAFVGSPYGSRANTINKLTDRSIKIDVYSRVKNISDKKKIPKSFIKNAKSAIDLIKFDIGRKVLFAAINQKFKRESVLNISNDYITFYEPVRFDELSSVYSSHSLSLSSTTARNTGILKTPVNVVNLRSFEIPMSGGLQICSYFDEVADYFEEDKEIILYHTNEEMIEKTKYYLRDENYKLRQKMKQNSRLRAESEHTWFKRFKKIFDNLGLKYDS